MEEKNKKIKELEDQIRLLKTENESLKQEESVFFSTTDVDSQTTDSEHEIKRKQKWKKKASKKRSDNNTEKKKQKKETLTRVLNKHQEILQGLGDRALNQEEDGYLRELINSLSKTSVIRALRDHTGTATTPNNVVEPPELPNDSANPGMLKDSISSLKDIYRTLLQGQENEDIAGYLRTATNIAQDNKLNKQQFFTLLKSRMVMGSDIYYDVANHEQNCSSIRVLFKELLPLYANYNTYLTCLTELNDYKPGAAIPPNQVLARIKTLATELCNTTNTADRRDFTYQQVRNKILCLYPDIAHKILEKESRTSSNDIATFTRIFLSLTPYQRKERQNKSSVLYVDKTQATSEQANLKTINSSNDDTPKYLQ